MTSSDPTRGGRRGRVAWWWALVVVAALVPSIGTLDTPLISDDGAALSWVHREGPFADWARPQYDLRSVRFWRPLVTTSLGLQERWTGVDPLPLRTWNLIGHGAAAVLFGLLALRLGGGRIGALVAGLLAAGYPEQGGNVTWIAGRVDSQCVPLLLLACVLALDGRQVGAVLVGLAAMATKELALVLPLWVLVLAWGRGESVRAAARRALPLGLALVAVVLWRRHALGTWIGGYPDERRELGLALVVPVVRNLALQLGIPAAVAVVLSFAAGGEVWTVRVRRLAAFGACGLLAAIPMIHLLSEAGVGEEHQRTFWLADGAFAIAIGVAVGAATSSGPAARRGLALLVAVLAFAGWRGERAWSDVRDWQRAGVQAEAEIDAASASIGSARSESAEDERRPRFAMFSRITPEGAYVLQWGVADRFRPPFRDVGPVWPWRPVFERPEAHRAWSSRGAFGRPRFVDDEGTSESGASDVDDGRELRIAVADGDPGGTFTAGVAWLVAEGEHDPSPRLLVSAPEGAAPAAYEVLLVTELGYRAAPLPAAGADGVTFTLREALLATSDAFLLALDFQTSRACLEVRALGPGGAQDVLAASPWIELTWDLATLRPAVLPLE